MDKNKPHKSICFADIDKSRLDEKTLKTIFMAILKALKFQHEERIIYYNDIKPHNITIHSRGNKIYAEFIDSGISASSTFGYEYMSPEQLNAQRENVGVSTDIWTFGVIVFETLCDQLPFGSPQHGDSNEKIISNIMDSNINPKVYHLVQPYKFLVWKCLQFNKDERFRSIGEIIELLENPSQAEQVNDPKVVTEDETKLFEDKISAEKYLAEVERFQEVMEKEAAPYLPPQDKKEVVEEVKEEVAEETVEALPPIPKKTNLLLWIIVILMLITSIILGLSFFININIFGSIILPSFTCMIPISLF